MTESIEKNAEIRKRIEVVFDEYDELGEKEFLDKYGRGRSKDYWVKSSIPKRRYDKYISKAVAYVAFGIKRKRYYGGWDKSNHACTDLHNSGYVIVDHRNKPVVQYESKGESIPLDNTDFLINGMERIIAVAINYFIEPAREWNEKTVTINIKALHDLIGLENKYDEVIEVLNSLDSYVYNVEMIGSSTNRNGILESLIFELKAKKSTYTIKNILDDGCFIAEDKLRMILDRFKSKKNLILQGPPGTGKTWLAKRMAYALIGEKDDSKILAKHFHPNLSYEDFIRGWRPIGEGKLELVDGPLLRFIEKARFDPKSKYVMVIEEINRGNPVQIFGEMLTLLETDKRNKKEALELTYRKNDNEKIYVPDNLFVIGTMNIADRSLALVDLALRRRFAFIDLEPIFGKVWRDWVYERNGVDMELLNLIENRLTKLNDMIKKDNNLGTQFKIGHSYVTPGIDVIIKDGKYWFRQVVETEIGPLLEEYWFDAPDSAKNAKNKLLEAF